MSHYIRESFTACTLSAVTFGKVEGVTLLSLTVSSWIQFSLRTPQGAAEMERERRGLPASEVSSWHPSRHPTTVTPAPGDLMLSSGPGYEHSPFHIYLNKNKSWREKGGT